MKRRALGRSRVWSTWVAGAAIAAALVAVPATARAQDQPASTAPAAGPAEPAPPARSYPPPPPRYPSAPPAPPTTWGQAPTWQQPGVNQNGQWPYYPVQPVQGIYRPFSFTVGVGPGGLFGPGERELALSYNLFRLGFGVVPDLQVILSFEGMGANSVSPLTGEDSWLKQENWLLGVQYHLLSRLYLRGGIGAGFVSEHTDTYSVSGGTGIAMSGGVGYEFVQTNHVALALDLNGSVTQYSKERWATTGLNLAVSFF